MCPNEKENLNLLLSVTTCLKFYNFGAYVDTVSNVYYGICYNFIIDEYHSDIGWTNGP